MAEALAIRKAAGQHPLLMKMHQWDQELPGERGTVELDNKAVEGLQ